MYSSYSHFVIIFLLLAALTCCVTGQYIAPQPHHQPHRTIFSHGQQQQQQLQQQNQQLLSPPPPLPLHPQQQVQITSAQTNPYLKATDEILLKMRSEMVSRSIKFDEHFKSLLTHSKVSLHNMFTDAYGMMYQHNTDIFTSMYEELEQYYAIGNIRLTQSMNRFFESLYQKIFQVYNINRSFTQSSLKCATEQLVHLKPFKDVPENLTDSIRHAFVAARTFVQALNNGIDVIKSIISVGQTAQCTHLINEKLLRNAHFGLTFGNNIISPPGVQQRQPCIGYCEQVITRCFVKEPLAQLNQKWSAYVIALGELGTKLSTSYNMETIIAPLDVQISEAIMLFQENATNISRQVFKACGLTPNLREDQNNQMISHFKQPSNRLSKRAANPGPAPAPVATRFNQNIANYDQRTSDDFSLNGHLRESASRDLSSQAGLSVPYIQAYMTPLGQKSPILIDEIKNYMLSTRNFWASLPNEVCTSNYTLGANATSYNRRQANCFQDKFEGFDINTDIRYKTEFDKQLVHLDDTRAKIESALAGREIIWTTDSYASTTIQQSSNGILGTRPPIIVTTSTSTTLEPMPTDEEDDEDTFGCEEEGSGEGCDSPTGDDELEATSERPDDDEGTEVTSEDNAQSSPESTEVDQVKSTTEIPDNGIDRPHIYDSQTDLITAGNLAGMQKSSQMSNKLVITNEAHLLLALLMSVVLLFVKNFQNDHQLII